MKKNMIKTLLFSLLMLMALETLGVDRIAVTSDGNKADPDDWGATPVTLAIFAKKGWQNKLVYYDYNNKYMVNNSSYAAEMTTSTLGAQSRFGYDSSRFFNCNTQRSAAISALKNQINASTSDNRLTIIVAGCYEIIWQALNVANTTPMQYVEVISHSVNNDEWSSGGSNNKADVARDFPTVKLTKIADQGGSKFGGGAVTDWGLVSWLNSSEACSEYNWVWSRIRTAGLERDSSNPCVDVSDAGTAYYVATGSDQGTFPKLETLLGYDWNGGGTSSIELTSPSNGAQFEAGSDIILSANASDSDGISAVRFWVYPENEAGYVAITDSSSPYSGTVNLAEGTYDVKARSTDSLGNTLDSTTVTITVSGSVEPAYTTLTSPGEGDQFTVGDDITLSADAYDSDGINAVRFWITPEGGSAYVAITDSDAPYSGTVSLAAGTYQVFARSKDNLDNALDSETVTITVVDDVIPAYTTLTSPAEGDQFTVGDDIALAADATDPDGINAVRFWVYPETEAGYVAITDSDAPYSGTVSLAAGTYQIKARSTDNLDNTLDSATVTITVSDDQQGINLVQNPSFANGTDSWSMGSTAQVSGGTLVLSEASSPTTQTIPTEVGVEYTLSVRVDASAVTSSPWVFDTADEYDDTCQFASGSNSGWTEYTGTFTAVDNSVTIRIFAEATFAGTVTFDDIVIAPVNAPSGYDTWASTNGITGGLTDDDDGDGLDNLCEYAIGEKPVFVEGDSGFEYRYLSRNDDPNVSCVVQVCTNLASGVWTDVATAPVDNGTVGSYDDVSYMIPDDGPQTYIRLEVTNQ